VAVPAVERTRDGEESIFPLGGAKGLVCHAGNVDRTPGRRRVCETAVAHAVVRR
jgi:hypothetical protein